MDAARVWSGKIYLVLAWLFLVEVFVQFFLAGAGIFGAHSINAHKDFASVLEVTAILLVVLSIVWQPGWDTVGMTTLLLVLVLIQQPLATAGNHWVQAFHPVVALLIAGLGVHARPAGPGARQRDEAGDDVAPPARPQTSNLGLSRLAALRAFCAMNCSTRSWASSS